MKLAFVTVLAIALNAPYAIAHSSPNVQTGTPTSGRTPGEIRLAKLSESPDSGTRNGGQEPGGNRTPWGTRLSQLPAAPPDSGTPNGNRKPGGSRGLGACEQTAQRLTALTPENANGLTTAEHPVFWFYIPNAPQDINSIEFSLHNQDETRTLYRTSLQLSKTSAVIGIPLPPSPESSLKPNESYHWYFKVNCEAKENSEENDIILDGWVTRVEPSPNLESQYGVIWHDELTNRAKRYLSEPQNLEVKNAWVELLRSVGLQELAQEPLVSSVSNPTND